MELAAGFGWPPYRRKNMHRKTIELIEAAYNVLAEYHPMTVRQVYYQLVSRHVIENKPSEYQKVSRILTDSRKNQFIPWQWIEDRVRQPRTVSMWQDLPDFMGTVKHAYRKDIWNDQPVYLEVWLEKDALSGVFADITERYGITLVVGRGYNSWSAYKEAASRFAIDKPAFILYFGDFDPSGEDIVRALRESLDFFETSPEIIKVALTLEDVKEYNLPPDFAKKTDTRSKAFIKKNGDMAVELDSLPMQVLEAKIEVSKTFSIWTRSLQLYRQRSASAESLHT